MKISSTEDYREFIKLRFAKLKESNKKFSYQQAANHLGTTKSYLKLVIDKKRHMSLNKVVPLALYFKLTSFETQYFIFLFLKNTAKNAAIKEFFSSILASYLTIARSGAPHPRLEDLPEHRSVNHNWIQMAILCLAERSDFKSESKWIQTSLGGAKILSSKEIETNLQALLDDGVLVQTKTGYKSMYDGLTSTLTPLDIDDFKALMLTGLKRAETAVQQKGQSSLHRPNRHHTYCLSMSHDEVDQVMKLSTDFIEKVLQIARNSTRDERVVFVSSHAFAISEK